MVDWQECIANSTVIVEGESTIAVQAEILGSAVIFAHLGLGAIQHMVADDGVDLDFAQKATASFDNTVEEESGRDANGDKDAVFDTAEDCHDYAREEDR